jgi:hypothetical protein
MTHLSRPSDGDGLTDALELAHRDRNPNDADSDDDGVLDGDEPGLRSATAMATASSTPSTPTPTTTASSTARISGSDAPSPDTDTGAGRFVPDADPSTRTNPLLADTDNGGLRDGSEDAIATAASIRARRPNARRDDRAKPDSDNDGLSDAPRSSSRQQPQRRRQR